ncbi:MAG TPA: NAD(P)-dependent oxidoreductase, partial [Steroidobacteraceae bacterium]|nr:NAD(P)-dependent oxidoreductase [Steroidobacteraceae bacterium]
ACGAELVALDELLRQADIISLHLPATPESRGMIGARELALLRPGAILINTARAALVDEPALLEALRSGRLGGAGLDVHAPEPLPADSPYFEFENVVLTPHIGWVTHEAGERLVQMPIDNVLAFLAGSPRCVVNPVSLAHPKHMAGR